MIKHWRIFILCVFVLGAILAIGFKIYPYGRHGVEIAYISENSPAFGILEQGMIITSLNGERIKNSDDWNRLAANLSGEVRLIANGEEYSFYVNDSIGIDVFDIERTNLEFGLDLKGGTRIVLKPKENASKEMANQIIATLQTRANLYGLKEMRIYPVSGPDGWYVQLEATGVGSKVINDLLAKQGKFEAKITKPVKIGQKLRIGQKSWNIELAENGIKIDGKIIKQNESITLDGIELEYVNRSEDSVIFLAKVFEGKDIELVYTDPQHSGIMPISGGYQFYFALLVSEKGAKRFADLTADIPKHLDPITGEEYLDSMLMLYLDNKLVSELRISADLAGKVITSPSVQGTRTSREEAIEEKLRLQTILRSGALPVGLEIVSTSIISPTLGERFFVSAGFAAIFAALAVITVVIIRYKSLKIAVPMLLTGLSEVLIILGIASQNDAGIWGIVLLISMAILGIAWWKKQQIDTLAVIGVILIPLLGMMSWTIDLPTIGGIIAAIGTGIDHQIIIADETLRRKKEEKIYSLKEKIARAFFIIFGAASTTIAAMVPMMFLGIGLVRGFAITTMVGVLVGVLITRPVYARIVEILLKA